MNYKLFIMLILVTGSISARRFGEGFAFGTLTGFGLGTFINAAPRRDVVVVQQPAPVPVAAPQPLAYDEREYQLERQRQKLELLKEQNKEKELALKERELALEHKKMQLAATKR